MRKIKLTRFSIVTLSYMNKRNGSETPHSANNKLPQELAVDLRSSIDEIKDKMKSIKIGQKTTQ